MVSSKKIRARLSYYFKLRVDKKTLAMLSILIIIYLSWLFAFPLFGSIIADFFGGFKALSIEKGKWTLLFLASMIASSLASGILVDKTSKRLLLVWIDTLVLSALTFAFLWVDFEVAFTLSIFLGLAAGVSPVAWGAYFADKTSPEDRGRTMGIPIGVMMLIAQFFLVSDIFSVGLTVNLKISIIGSWLLITFLALVFRPNVKKQEEAEQTSSSRGKKGPGTRQIVLYAIPVFLFYWVAGILLSITFPTVQNNFENEIFYLFWAVPFFIGAVMGGVFLDLQGRKFPSIVGLAITGLSLAIFGVVGIRLTNLVLISLAIGYSFLTVLSFIIWADLAPRGARGKYYGGGLGLMSTALLTGLISTGAIFGSVAISQITSYMLLSSVALFLCIPPIIMAEETLPKEVIEQRKLLEYLDGVKSRFGRKKQA